MGSPRSERRRSFSVRYSVADSGSGSMSEMEEESKVRQQCFGKVAEIILLAQNKMISDCHIPFRLSYCNCMKSLLSLLQAD